MNKNISICFIYFNLDDANKLTELNNILNVNNMI